MIGIGARLRYYADVGASITPIGSVVESGLDLEFLDGIGVGYGNPAARRSAPLDVAYADTVQLEVIVVRPCPVNKKTIVSLVDLRQSRIASPEFPGVAHA